MERRNGTPRYVVRIQDCKSGDQLAILPQTDILASVQVPACWLNGQLYMKEVPRSLVASAERQAELIDEDFLVSLSKWCPYSREYGHHFESETKKSSSINSACLSALATRDLGTSFMYNWPLSQQAGT